MDQNQDQLQQVTEYIQKVAEYIQKEYCDCDERCPKCGKLKRAKPWSVTYSTPWTWYNPTQLPYCHTCCSYHNGPCYYGSQKW